MSDFSLDCYFSAQRYLLIYVAFQRAHVSFSFELLKPNSSKPDSQLLLIPSSVLIGVKQPGSVQAEELNSLILHKKVVSDFSDNSLKYIMQTL